MVSEFRLILTGTFVNAADRDACFAALKTQIQTYNTNNPGKLKRADILPFRGPCEPLPAWSDRRAVIRWLRCLLDAWER
jgi:hypothetical protein